MRVTNHGYTFLCLQQQNALGWLVGSVIFINFRSLYIVKIYISNKCGQDHVWL